MKRLFTSIVFFLTFFSLANAQETVTIKLNGSGGYRTITCNGQTSNRGKMEVVKGSLVELGTTAGDPDSKKFAFFTINKSYTNGGAIVSNRNPYGFIAEESATFYINYVDKDEDLTANANITATEGGYIQGYSYGHIYTLGEAFDFKAVANEGYSFVNWTDADNNIVCTEERFTGVITAKELTYTANFVSTTGIREIDSEKEVVIYDLTGRKVEKATKGIYIVNGKKVFKK
jgi:hypothetical protein